MLNRRFSGLMFLVFFITISGLRAETSVPAPKTPTKILQVGVMDRPPYVIVKDGVFRGISVDLWDLVARHLGYKYQFVLMGDSITDNIEALENGKIDVFLGPIYVTHQHSLKADFTRPYALNRIGIVVHKENKSLAQTVSHILERVFTFTLLAAVFALIIYIHVIWLLERGKFAEMPTEYFKGIAYTFWLTLLRKGSWPAIPTTVAGRIVNFMWISGSTIILSVVYATVIASFHISFGEQGHSNHADFSQKNLVAIDGSAGYEYAKNAGLHIITVENLSAGISLVLERKVDGFVANSAVLYYYLREHKLQHELELAHYTLKTSILAFAFPKGSPLLQDVNAELSYLEDFNLNKANCEKYLDVQSSVNCL